MNDQMRRWMLLIENAQPPKWLFHGTSDVAWEEIQETNRMEDSPDQPSGGVCFSASRRVAEEFARFSCQRHDTEKGVVIEFDGAMMAQDHHLVPYYADLSNPFWKITDEEEWRSGNEQLENVMKYVRGTYDVWRDSHDDAAEWGPGATQWRNE